MIKTREKLLQAGIKYFGSIPYEKVSVEEITSAAKVNISAVSYYFGGKENFYKAVINRLNQSVVNKLSMFDISLLSKETDLDKARKFVEDFLGLFYKSFISPEGNSRVNIFLRELTAQGNSEIKDLFNNHVGFSYRLLKQVLSIYFDDLLKTPTDNIEFKIIVFFSVLKDLATNTQKPQEIKNIYEQDVYSQLINFMLK